MKRRYRKLRVWQQAVELYGKIYIVTESFPSEARGFVLQLRRPAAAVFMNIAESTLIQDQRRAACLQQASSALREVETQLHLALRYGYVGAAILEGLLQGLSDLSADLCLLIEQTFADSTVSLISPAHQPNADGLEHNDKGSKQEVYVSGSLSGGSGWNRQPALAE